MNSFKEHENTRHQLLTSLQFRVQFSRSRYYFTDRKKFLLGKILRSEEKSYFLEDHLSIFYISTVFVFRKNVNFLKKLIFHFVPKRNIIFTEKKKQHLYRTCSKLHLERSSFILFSKRNTIFSEKRTLSFPITLKISDFNLNFLRGTSFLKMLKTELWFLIQCIEMRLVRQSFQEKVTSYIQLVLS